MHNDIHPVLFLLLNQENYAKKQVIPNIYELAALMRQRL